MNSSKNLISRAVLLFLCAAIAASAASCGSAKPTVTDSTDSNPASGSETEAETEADYLEKYAGTDFGGATYTFGTFTSDFYPNYVGDDINGETVNDVQYSRDIWVESNYNVNIDYTVFDSSDKIVAAVRSQVLSGDHNIDCIEGAMTYCLSTISAEGLLYNLKSIDNLELDASWWSQTMNKEFTINDSLFTITGPLSFSYYYSPRLVAYNLRLADEYKVGNLYEVVESGKWTLDYMNNSMKSVTSDLNGDGEMGEDDMWGASVDEYSAAGFYISAGGTQISVDKDGVPSFLFDDANNFRIIEKVASIIGNKDVTQKAEQLANRSGTYDIKDKVYTFKNGHALYFGYGAQAISFYLRDMADDYGIIPVPKIDENQEKYITFGNAFVPGYIALPKNNDRGEMNGVLLNTLGYISQRDVQPLVASVTLKGKAARDEGSLKMIDIIYEDIYLDLNSCYDFGGSFTLLRDITMGKTENFKSSWDSKKSASETALQKLFDQFAAIE